MHVESPNSPVPRHMSHSSASHSSASHSSAAVSAALFVLGFESRILHNASASLETPPITFFDGVNGSPCLLAEADGGRAGMFELGSESFIFHNASASFETPLISLFGGAGGSSSILP